MTPGKQMNSLFGASRKAREAKIWCRISFRPDDMLDLAQRLKLLEPLVFEPNRVQHGERLATADDVHVSTEQKKDFILIEPFT